MDKIKYFVMDVDGTLTDGKIYMGDEGEMMKAFSIKDGLGIHDILPQWEIVPIIITGRSSKIMERRCKELGIYELHQGVGDKVRKLEEILLGKKAVCSNIAYIGDDLNDLPCMQFIKESGGVVGCPKDAAEQVKKYADFVSRKNGGDGAVREFIEWIVVEAFDGIEENGR